MVEQSYHTNNNTTTLFVLFLAYFSSVKRVDRCFGTQCGIIIIIIIIIMRWFYSKIH